MENKLDERQEQALLKIEHSGCWFVFWSLLVVMIVEMTVLGYTLSQIAGEWIVFMILSIYLSTASLKEGIWDRHFNPDRKTNALISLLAGGATGILTFLQIFLRYKNRIVGSLVAGLFIGVFVFVACFAALSISAGYYKKKEKQMEEEEEV